MSAATLFSGCRAALLFGCGVVALAATEKEFVAVPLISSGGRLWRAFEEYMAPKGSWSGTYLKSLSEDADWLNAHFKKARAHARQ